MPYSKFSLINPLVMNREDLLEQKQLLREYLVDEGGNFTVNAMAEGNALSAQPFHSVDEMFRAEFPKTVDQLTIDAREMCPDGTRISKSIRLLLDKKMADFRIYSDVDKEWVENTTKDLNKFYSKKSSWYAGLKSGMAPLSNITMVAALFLITMAWTSNYKALIILPILLALYSVGMLTMSLKGFIYPYSEINFISKNEVKRPNYEMYSLIGWLILLFVTVTSIVLLR